MHYNTFLYELDELYSTYLFILNHCCSCIMMLFVHFYPTNTFQNIEDWFWVDTDPYPYEVSPFITAFSPLLTLQEPRNGKC